jgi:single-stranded-DNA-specific exonuclease
VLNAERRAIQDKIYREALVQAEQYKNDNVLVVSNTGWSHGVIGIVAAKLLEKYHKPTYVLEEMGEEAKGSARSFGDFSAADAIRAADDIITKGGGHKLAAGVSLPTANIAAFRTRLNEFYRAQKLVNQASLLLPHADVSIERLGLISEELIKKIAQLEPFGNGNPEPVLYAENLLVMNQRRMGAEMHMAIVCNSLRLAPQSTFLSSRANGSLFGSSHSLMNGKVVEVLKGVCCISRMHNA